MADATHDGGVVGGKRRQVLLFLAGVLFLGTASGIFETTFNNFLSDTFSISADARGFLEFPRELPGFLTALFAGLLFFLPETMVASMAALAVGLGMFGLAVWGSRWGAMMLFMVIWSTGVHLMMPIRSSVTMHLAGADGKGKRLGQVAGVGLAATLAGCSLVWFITKYLTPNYRVTFLIGGGAALMASVVFAMMRLPGAHLRRPRFVWNKAYGLYYVLAVLFGARKQIFITFGPWVLVRVFDQPAYVIAQLWIVAAVLGMLFQPLLGRAIDRFGERRILMLDSVCVFLVCMGYGLSHLAGSREAGLWVLYACYVGDNLLFGVNMARTTYMSKIALKPEHVAPTLSLGVTINHVVSMSIPALGGLVWVRYGHEAVFFGAAGIAMVMLVASHFVLHSTGGAD